MSSLFRKALLRRIKYVCMHATKFSPLFIKMQLFIEPTKTRGDFDDLVHKRLLICQNDSDGLNIYCNDYLDIDFQKMVRDRNKCSY